MNRLASLTLAAACVVPCLPAAAQFAKTDDAVTYRQSVMFIQGQHMGRLGAMANGRIPYDATVAVANADVLHEMAKLPWPAFAPGTEGGKSRPAVWQEHAKFNELGERLVAETGKLAVAAKAGDLDALKSAIGAVGETCKACHDSFRRR